MVRVFYHNKTNRAVEECLQMGKSLQYVAHFEKPSYV